MKHSEYFRMSPQERLHGSLMLMQSAPSVAALKLLISTKVTPLRGQDHDVQKIDSFVRVMCLARSPLFPACKDRSSCFNPPYASRGAFMGTTSR